MTRDPHTDPQPGDRLVCPWSGVEWFINDASTNGRHVYVQTSEGWSRWMPVTEWREYVADWETP